MHKTGDTLFLDIFVAQSETVSLSLSNASIVPLVYSEMNRRFRDPRCLPNFFNISVRIYLANPLNVTMEVRLISDNRLNMSINWIHRPEIILSQSNCFNDNSITSIYNNNLSNASLSNANGAIVKQTQSLSSVDASHASKCNIAVSTPIGYRMFAFPTQRFVLFLRPNHSSPAFPLASMLALDEDDVDIGPSSSTEVFMPNDILIGNASIQPWHYVFYDVNQEAFRHFFLSSLHQKLKNPHVEDVENPEHSFRAIYITGVTQEMCRWCGCKTGGRATRCGHHVCADCFCRLFLTRDLTNCPACRM